MDAKSRLSIQQVIDDKISTADVAHIIKDIDDAPEDEVIQKLNDLGVIDSLMSSFGLKIVILPILQRKTSSQAKIIFNIILLLTPTDYVNQLARMNYQDMFQKKKKVG